MVFGNKNTCPNCEEKIKGKFSFCPFCGESTLNSEKHAKDYGLLGQNDNTNSPTNHNSNQGFGITDKIIGSLVNSLMKNLDKQFKNLEKQPNNLENAEIQNLPNGIKIRIGPAVQQKKKKQKNFFKKTLSEQQLEKMSSLPRTPAKTKMKRIGNRVVYELNTPGIESHQDVFVSKLESGYEIKAIGTKKIYVNTLPVNLPIRSFAINNNKLFVEFHNPEQF